MIGVLNFSGCTTTKWNNLHVAVDISNPCVLLFEELTSIEKQQVFPKPFDKENLTESEKIIDSVGRKISSNYQTCGVRYNENRGNLTNHNQLHEDK